MTKWVKNNMEESHVCEGRREPTKHLGDIPAHVCTEYRHLKGRNHANSGTLATLGRSAERQFALSYTCLLCALFDLLNKSYPYMFEKFKGGPEYSSVLEHLPSSSDPGPFSTMEEKLCVMCTTLCMYCVCVHARRACTLCICVACVCCLCVHACIVHV